MKLSRALGAIGVTLLGVAGKSRAIGTMFELKDQSLVLQDIGLNVIESDQEIKMLTATFDNVLKVINSSKYGKITKSVLGFGPETYTSRAAFVPG